MSLPQITSPFTFQNTYAALGESFAVPTLPTPVAAPHWLAFNAPLSAELGVNMTVAVQEALLPALAGNALLAGSTPVAQAYAGHQFGHFNPQLGDGRAILLGEIITPQGLRKDIQLKGAGMTPFSRSGDGRAALGPVVREYLLSEAMHALGIKTTRALAAVVTGQPVYRETPLPGAILTRVASSHIRIGTFEYFARRGEITQVKRLSDHVIARHYRECAKAQAPYKALFEAVMAAQIDLVARWMQVGFIHGVMNTDNMSIAGETIDYGPCAFMDSYDPATQYSAIDVRGRYAFGHQKSILQWNLARFAECLLRLIDEDVDVSVAYAEQALAGFSEQFDAVYFGLMAKKIGLQSRAVAEPIVIALLALLETLHIDYTLAFRQLGQVLLMGTNEPFLQLLNDHSQTGQPEQQQEVIAWLERWKSALAEQGDSVDASADGNTAANAALVQGMQQVNPAIIPRNHQVEAVITEAVAVQQNMTASTPACYPKFEALRHALQTPYDSVHESSDLAQPPTRAEQRSYKTFCGT
ncbi:protein adenylyltransferase SelO [Marinagarivorans algicola]|uniref:protein adenylyltransferase SelO n=1 Tax=Marinagarivorans algicola TaxID=1513270 RepID=UPI0006B99CBC|nr:YdiU family protein [Marinagarivorans algicola]